MPFSFLATVQRKFIAAHSSPPASQHALQQAFGPTLSELLTQFNSQQNPSASSSQSPDALYQAQNELNQVKDIMVHNVEQILSRGERIELLVDKTDTMAGQSLAFRRGAKTTRRKMFWRNQKVVALGVAVGLVSIFFFAELCRHCPFLTSSIVRCILAYSAVLRRCAQPLRRLIILHTTQPTWIYLLSSLSFAYCNLYSEFITLQSVGIRQDCHGRLLSTGHRLGLNAPEFCPPPHAVCMTGIGLAYKKFRSHIIYI